MVKHVLVSSSAVHWFEMDKVRVIKLEWVVS